MFRLTADEVLQILPQQRPFRFIDPRGGMYQKKSPRSGDLELFW